MIPKNILDIKKDDVDKLLENKIAEAQTIEYKRELPLFTDSAKKEFLADITSFANSSGGDIFYGISAEDGIPTELIGLKDCPKEDRDKIKLRLECIIGTNVDPRLVPQVQIQFIDGFPTGPILLIRVFKSWNAPHMIGPKDKSRFYARHSAGKYTLDCSQIHSAFMLSDNISERIANFRNDRIAKIMVGETPILLSDKPKIVLHLLPVSAFADGGDIDVSMLSQHSVKFPLLSSAEASSRVNFDGYVRYCNNIAYLQLFRKAQIESVYAGYDGRPISILAIERLLIEKLGDYLKALKFLHISCPLVIYIALLNVKGVSVELPSSSLGNLNPIDRANLLLPNLMLENYDEASDSKGIAKLLKPAFDMICQAVGFPIAVGYDTNGNWDPKR